MIDLKRVLVLVNSNAALSAFSNQVADYYISARGLNPANKWLVDLGGSTGTSSLTAAQCYANVMQPLAAYIASKNIHAVICAAGVPEYQNDGSGVLRSFEDMLGHAPWIVNTLGAMPLTGQTYNHTLADLSIVPETFGASTSYKGVTANYVLSGNAAWRPFGRVGIGWQQQTSADFPAIKRVIDDAIASETSIGAAAMAQTPIHVHLYDRALPFIAGLQAWRARDALLKRGLNVKHSINGTQVPGYSADWTNNGFALPADSYGSWANGELAANPQPVWGLVTQSLVNVTSGAPWLNSFTPQKGGWMLNPTSTPNPAVLDFIAKGGCVGVSTIAEPLTDGLPNVGTFVYRLLDGMSVAEANILSLLKGAYMLQVKGDPLYRPFGRNGNTVRNTRRSSRV